MPIKVKKRRQVQGEDDSEMVDESATGQGGTKIEEYYDYVFPDDEKTGHGDAAKRNLKLLEMAHKWKQDGDQ